MMNMNTGMDQRKWTQDVIFFLLQYETLLPLSKPDSFGEDNSRTICFSSYNLFTTNIADTITTNIDAKENGLSE